MLKPCVVEMEQMVAPYLALALRRLPSADKKLLQVRVPRRAAGCLAEQDKCLAERPGVLQNRTSALQSGRVSCGTGKVASEVLESTTMRHERWLGGKHASPAGRACSR